MATLAEQIAAIDANAAALPKEPPPPAIGERAAGAPSELYDPNTGKLLALDTEAATKAVAEGTAVPRSDARVNVIGPDGQKGSVTGSELSGAVKSGYRLESGREGRVNDYLQANEGLAGSARVGVGKALSELAFGVPEMVYEHTANPEDVAQWNALKEAHPVASAVGSAAGFGGSMLIGGPLFQSATKAGKAVEGAMLASRAAPGIATRLASTAARVGTEGAVLAAPQVITEAALGDPALAGEHLLAGLGGGLALGAVGKVASYGLKGIGKLAEASVEHLGVSMRSSNPLGELAEKQAFRSLMHSQDERGIRLAERAGGVKDVGRYVLDNGLFRNTGESFETYANRIGERREEVGQQIGALYKELDAAGARGPSAEELYERFRQEVIDPLKAKSTRAAEVARLESYTDNFLQSARIQREARGFTSDSAHSLYDLWETRKDLAAKIYQEKRTVGNLTPIDQQLDKFRVMLDDAIGGSAPKEFKRAIDPLNRDYRMLSTVDGIVETSVRREAKNRNLSLSDYLAGGHAGVGIAAALHSPIAGLAAWGVSAAHKWVRENGNILVARYADRLGTYLAHNAVTGGERSMARIPSLLGGMTAGKRAELAATNGFHLFLGPSAEKHSDEQNFHAISDQITSAAADPTHATRKVQALSQWIANGAPTVAQQYEQAELRRAQWLQSQLPKPPPPQPFAPEWRPTKQQIRDFKDKLAVAIDPHVLTHEMARGTITPAHVAAARAVWPATYDRMVSEVKSWGLTKPAKNVPYRARLAISLAVGEPLDPSTRALATLQQNFAGAPPQSPSAAPIGKLPAAQYTQQQRLLG
jgi:hypothetical protein